MSEVSADTWCMPIVAVSVFLAILAFSWVWSVVEFSSEAKVPPRGTVGKELGRNGMNGMPGMQPKKPEMLWQNASNTNAELVHADLVYPKFKLLQLRGSASERTAFESLPRCTKLPQSAFSAVMTMGCKKLSNAEEFEKLPVPKTRSHFVVSGNWPVHIYVNPTLHVYQVSRRHVEVMSIPWRPDIETAWSQVRRLVGKLLAMRAVTDNKRGQRQEVVELGMYRAWRAGSY
eukprot:Skav231306  [mRNA]  locus=scaffold161:327355:328047:- [translate_table: standard]